MCYTKDNQVKENDMPSGHDQAHMVEMREQNWEYIGDGRFQHPDGKEVYGGVVAFLRMREGHLGNVHFYAHDTDPREVQTEVIAEKVYGRWPRCLSSDVNVFIT